MKTLTFYLLRHLTVATLFVTIGLAMLIWLTQSVRLIELVIEGGAPLALFGELMLVTLPTFLSIVLPIALVAAILFSYNRLTMDSELVVMRAAGLGPWRLGRPAVLLALIVTAICFALTLEIAPAANRELVKLERLARSGYSTVFLREGVFNDVSDGLTVYVRRRDPDGELQDLVIHDTRVPGKPVTVLAEKGMMVDGPTGPRVIVFNGHRQEIDLATGRMSQLDFDRYAIDLKLFDENLGDRVPDPRERSMADLLAAHHENPGAPGRNRLMAELHQRLSGPLLTLSFAVIGLASLLSGEFNRRGQSRRIIAAVAMVVLLQAASLGMSNVAVNRPVLIPLMYLVPLAPIAVGIWYLRRGPARRRHPVPA